jgi:hypothetical protein
LGLGMIKFGIKLKIRDQIKNLIVIKQQLLNKKNWWGTELSKINNVCEKTIIFERHVQLSPGPDMPLFKFVVLKAYNEGTSDDF